MKTLIIFGATAFSRLIKDAVEEDTGRQVAAYCVNRSYLDGTTQIDNIPVVAFEDLDSLFEKGQLEVLITVGYAKMNDSRARVFNACEERGYLIASFVHSTVRCKADEIGHGNIILADCVLHPHSTLGDGNILVNDTVIGHDTKVGSFNFMAGITTGGLSVIGDHCFLGIKSIVCNNCKVGDYTLLGAGTVLSSDSEDHTVVMPARNRTIRLDAKGMASMLI